MVPHETSFTRRERKQNNMCLYLLCFSLGLDLSRTVADVQKTHQKKTHIFSLFALFFQKPQIMDQVNVTRESTVFFFLNRSDLVYMGEGWVELILNSP